MQQQKDAYNRRHNDHTHNMTLSTPRKDNRIMNIPENTIQPLGNPTLNLPFRYLRTWIFSLLALVCLPIGIGLIMIGVEMQEDLSRDWEELTATVIRNDEESVRYEIDNGDEGEFGYTLDDFVDADTPGELVWTISACDLLSRVIIPKENGAEFQIWIDPRKSSNQSCVPINEDSASLYLVTGFVLAGLSAFRLFRTFNDAALRKK